MTCKDCLHIEPCYGHPIEELTNEANGICEPGVEKQCEWFKDKTKIMELPFIAMIEQHLVNGKFINSNIQNKNGMYAVVYIDKSKYGIPLIDICGKSPYNGEESEARLKELQNG